MKFIVNAIKKAKERRLAKKAEKQRLNQLFDSFAEETRPFVPKAPNNPLAALYRLCWKRAIVLQDIYNEEGNNPEKVNLYKQFQKIAVDRYSPIAPENAYGRVYLKINGEAQKKMKIQELKRMQPDRQSKIKRNLELSCIYRGKDTIQQKSYIGQTSGNPETRWKEHRSNGSGPFKNGASYATWTVLKEKVPKAKLDELESYYIGFYNAYDDGHNETCGNDWQAYQRGLSDKYKDI